MNIFDQFDQQRHPKDCNDYYHCFNASNILNVVYWNEFFKIVKNFFVVIVTN